MKNLAIMQEREKENIRFSYDQIRKEKMDLEDQNQQLQNQEKTYKVAYEDWKSKYDLLEIKFNSLKKDLESKSQTSNSEISKIVLSAKNSESNSSNTELSQITLELKKVLDQHLEILSQFISSDKKTETEESVESKQDPLHWIMGIDEDTSKILKNQGISSFEQLYDLSKNDVKKLMIQFDHIDDRIIESWPLQAGALIRSNNRN